MIKNYVVSSAGWNIDIDDIDTESAAKSAIIFMLLKNNKNTELSTTIMVNSKNGDSNDDITDADFFASHHILRELGLDKLSDNFLIFTEILNENKCIK